MSYTKVRIERTKERLEDLRREKKLTFKKLSEELSEKGTFITNTNLKNYEINDETHELYNRTKGMSIENLVGLADFYKVSTDYLLGRAKNKTTDNEEIRKRIGLLDESIEFFEEAKQAADGLNYPIEMPDGSVTMGKFIPTGGLEFAYRDYLDIINGSIKSQKYYIERLLNNLKDYLRSIRQFHDKRAGYLKNREIEYEYYVKTKKDEDKNYIPATNKDVYMDNQKKNIDNAVKFGIRSVPTGFPDEIKQAMREVGGTRYDTERAFDTLLEQLTSYLLKNLDTKGGESNGKHNPTNN